MQFISLENVEELAADHVYFRRQYPDSGVGGYWMANCEPMGTVSIQVTNDVRLARRFITRGGVESMVDMLRAEYGAEHAFYWSVWNAEYIIVVDPDKGETYFRSC